ncbi:MAG: rhodanese-like domain-containing protein [Solobacterium sp.]|nr:rhodanese-like domain-containing protein [Solobacterium sp.]
MFMRKDINEYLKEKENNTILLDVRTREEYKEGHIPGSINVELDYIDSVTDVIKDKDSKIYLYCRSGHRSGIALNRMKELGYTDLTNIGGIMHYKGEIG